jgi:hypothetical protein
MQFHLNGFEPGDPMSFPKISSEQIRAMRQNQPHHSPDEIFGKDRSHGSRREGRPNLLDDGWRSCLTRKSDQLIQEISTARF